MTILPVCVAERFKRFVNDPRVCAYPLRTAVAIAAFGAALSSAPAEVITMPNADPIARVDRIVRAVLAKTGVPSASLAVVEDGHLMYAQAYGLARQKPRLDAKPDLPYSIGSISKQFTAAATLLLQEEHRLSLSDKVGKWLPELTRANDITVQQVLSMTSGYQDYAPQDYMVPEWNSPISPD